MACEFNSVSSRVLIVIYYSNISLDPRFSNRFLDEVYLQADVIGLYTVVDRCHF